MRARMYMIEQTLPIIVDVGRWSRQFPSYIAEAPMSYVPLRFEIDHYSGMKSSHGRLR